MGDTGNEDEHGKELPDHDTEGIEREPRSRPSRRAGAVRGMKHGLSLVAYPDTTRLRQLVRETESQKVIAEAWKQVGSVMNDSF